VAYNVAATVASIPAGRLRDRRGAVRVLVLGVALFGLAYAGFAAGPASVLALAPWFVAAGVGIGGVETAEHAAVAALAPLELRGSAFGLLAAVQSFGNLAASGDGTQHGSSVDLGRYRVSVDASSIAVFRWIVGQYCGRTLGWPRSRYGCRRRRGWVDGRVPIGRGRTAADDCGVALAGDERPATER
jgi:MFS family permease